MKNKSLNRKQLSATHILDTLEQNRAILKKMGVQKIGLFGSYRHGSASLDSDIDLLIQLDHNTFDRYMDVKIYLEDLYLRKIDLVLEETIKPGLRLQILEEVVYASGL